jgi:hypothetical protein
MICFTVKEQKASEINEIRKSHEVYIARLEEEHAVAVKKLQFLHGESIKTLQTKQENQMEGKLFCNKKTPSNVVLYVIVS